MSGSNDDNDTKVKSAHARRKRPVPSHKKPRRHHAGLMVLLIILIMLVIGGWLWLNVKDDRPASKATVSRSATVKRKSHSSGHRVQSPVASVKAPLALPEAEIQKASQQTIGQVAGDNSVYVAKIGTAGAYAENIHAQRAASDIKIFIMVTAFERLAAGKLDLDDHYTVQEADKVGGSGVMQQLPAGTEMPLRQVMQYMMSDSDNLASNVMIDAVGGMATVNRECAKLGATDTVLARKLMDTQALAAGHDNMTSARDLGRVLTAIYQRQLISRSASAQMLALLAANKNHTKLPARIPTAKVYNKTGEFGDYGVQNDAAIIANDTDAAIVAVVMSEDGSEQQQIQAQAQFGEALFKLLLS